MKGIQCNELQGAMYAFPKIDIPRRAIEYARVNEIFEYNSGYCYFKEF
jgi:aspartate/methionine/tyrosine aminotransferase